MAGRGKGAGSIRKLPSGRWQARYRTPDGERNSAPSTFLTKRDASAWLIRQLGELAEGTWKDPKAGLEHFDTSAERWLTERTIKPRTREHYRAVLIRHVLPAFGDMPLVKITPPAVKAWYAELNAATPTMRAHAYSLLRSVLGSAVSDDLIPSNPCRIRGASSAKRAVRIRPATLAELDAATKAMPDRLRLMVSLAAWCGLRFGELTELRRSDMDTKRSVVRVRRGVARIKGGRVVGTPKSDAGTREVAIPPHLVTAVTDHLARHTAAELNALLFPGVHGGHLSPASLYDHWYPAREAAGRADLRFHDLRHTGATMTAMAGATLAELMRRLGHSTPTAALRYQHAADDRDKALAAALSGFATAQVIPLRPRGVVADQ